MPRPENPITGSGPAADLARELRRLRDSAGRPGYRDLGIKACFGPSTLADAARGRVRPTWPVARAFAEACGAGEADLDRVQALWVKADKAERRSRDLERRSWQAQIVVDQAQAAAKSRRARSPSAAPPRPAGRPRPLAAGTAAQFVRQLRALRAWSGRAPNRATVPRTTFYDALSPSRTTLPTLRVTRAIVGHYAPEAIEEWTGAWQAIKLREFEEGNPLPQGLTIAAR